MSSCVLLHLTLRLSNIRQYVCLRLCPYSAKPRRHVELKGQPQSHLLLRRRSECLLLANATRYPRLLPRSPLLLPSCPPGNRLGKRKECCRMGSSNRAPAIQMNVLKLLRGRPLAWLGLLVQQSACSKVGQRTLARKMIPDVSSSCSRSGFLSDGGMVDCTAVPWPLLITSLRFLSGPKWLS